MSEYIDYNNSKAASGELIDSLIGGFALNYVGHRVCVRKSSLASRRAKMYVKLGELARRKKLAGYQEMKRLHRATSNGAWLSAVSHRLNGTELSQEELRDNLCLQYGLMLQDIPATCNGCGNKLSIEHALLCPKGGLVLELHDYSAKEWVALGSRAIIPSAFTYEHKNQ